MERTFYFIMLIFFAMNGLAQQNNGAIQIFETAANGNKLTSIAPARAAKNAAKITLIPQQKFQKIVGFGGSFTESSAYLLNKLSKPNSEKILDAYFGENGARYSLTRTHINSCDFSLGHYAYANVAGDTALQHFSIAEDANDLIPMIRSAMQYSKEGFKIIASPWTAPPWMKTNGDWKGGKLLPQYQPVWALYFSKYIQAYKKEGIDIWGLTVENEPLGNDNNWESMHFTPEEMTDFVVQHLGPRLQQDGYSHINILGFDQNRGEELEKWARAMFRDEKSASYFQGTAVHWYASTYDYFPASLQYTHQLAPGKYIINTEACVDAQVPVWNDDNWYWSPNAKDWGWTWAAEKDKHLHPAYVPVFRYARDIIGCLNNYVNGWVDWNMVLDRQGGPNWFKNWCTAPVIVDPEKDEIYFTPLFYTMAHFSKYIRPGAVRIGFENSETDLMVTAAQNPDGSVAVVVFNPSNSKKNFNLKLKKKTHHINISAKAIQTIILNQ